MNTKNQKSVKKGPPQNRNKKRKIGVENTTRKKNRR